MSLSSMSDLYMISLWGELEQLGGMSLVVIRHLHSGVPATAVLGSLFQTGKSE